MKYNQLTMGTRAAAWYGYSHKFMCKMIDIIYLQNDDTPGSDEDINHYCHPGSGIRIALKKYFFNSSGPRGLVQDV